jgi:hypothetical protein
METPHESLVEAYSNIMYATKKIIVALYYLEIVMKGLGDDWDLYIAEDALSEAQQVLGRAREWIKKAKLLTASIC